MIRIETSVHIDRHPDQVFEFISNFENNPKWQSGMVSAEFTSQRPLRIGSTYSQKAKFLGRPVISEFEVIEYVPNRMVKAASISGSFPITFTRTVRKENNGALVSAIIVGDAGGFFKLAEPLLRRMVQKSVDEDYRNLKRILEAET